MAISKVNPNKVRKVLEDLDCPWDICRVNKSAHAANSDNLRVLHHIVQMVSFLCDFLCFHIISLKSASRFRPTLYITPVINTALPCILYNQRDEIYTIFFIIISTLHVSGGKLPQIFRALIIIKNTV
jgi:hypothetical protein